uniref:Uncharacterized protein n=1 Tax=uncultured marine group II/III euryarchaeote KM3_160_F12 TaxID=1457912 RepID=A0A075GMT9_9EURY|nr:hypothetical protein [uncultured marine group II/III euryarchaeote KM3_160_F12]
MISINNSNRKSDDEIDTRISGLFFSCLVALVSFLMITTLIQDSIIKPRLYDGSINELGRYSMTFDGYLHIEENSQNSVIAIGSSKMREAFDGVQIGNEFGGSYDFYNLAVAGDRPYVRMLEIDAIISANPKYVVLEIGPNSFSFLSTPVPESTLSRMGHLSALGNVDLNSYPDSVLNKSDLVMLPSSKYDQEKLIASYSLEAIEDTIEIELFDENPPWSCSGRLANVRCVPLPTNSTFDQYLRYPTQFGNTLEKIKTGAITKWTIEEFYGAKLDQYINGSYHNPEGIMNKNQMSFEYIIDELIKAEIGVILVGLPYNPVLLDRLHWGQWDYYNESVREYSLRDTISVIDMMWDDDWEEVHFNDFTHMSRQGELLFAEKLHGNLSIIMEAN